MKKNKEITIEHLARMVKTGFDGVDRKMDKEFRKVGEEFKKVNERFDKIEDLILADHKRRIEKLENEVKNLKDLLAIK